MLLIKLFEGGIVWNSIVGIAEFPLRTVITKHTKETANISGEDQLRSKLGQIPGNSPVVQFPGFKAQIIKSDSVRGVIYIESECRGVLSFNDMFFNINTFDHALETLILLLKSDQNKFSHYFSKEMLNVLHIATFRQKYISKEYKYAPMLDISKDNKKMNENCKELIRFIERQQPNEDDRNKLLVFWESLFSSKALIQIQFLEFGGLKILKEFLNSDEDEEMIHVCLEGLKHFFLHLNFVNQLFENEIVPQIVQIIRRGASNSSSAQNFMSAVDILAYFDDYHWEALIGLDITSALYKVATNPKEFLVVRTKALDAFKTFPRELQSHFLSTGITEVIINNLCTNSSKKTQQDLIYRLLGFLRFLGKSTNVLKDENLYPTLIDFLRSNAATEANKIVTLDILSDILDDKMIKLIEIGLVQVLIDLASQGTVSGLLRQSIIAHFNHQVYYKENIIKILDDMHLMRAIIDIRTPPIDLSKAMKELFWFLFGLLIFVLRWLRYKVIKCIKKR